MKKLSGRLLSLLIAFVLVLGCVTAMPNINTNTSAAENQNAPMTTPKGTVNGVQYALNTIKAVYPDQYKYFTASGNACTDPAADDCYIKNIPARGGLPSGQTVYNNGAGGGWSCNGFARYVFGYTFGENFRAAPTVSTPSVGDVLYTTSSYGDHFSIYLGEDSSYWYVFDSNASFDCSVRYNGKLSKSANTLQKIYHASSYNTVYNKNYTDSSPSYSTFTEDMYYIKNNYDGKYLSVNGYKDAQAQNVGTWELNFPTVNEPIEFQMNFTKMNSNGAYKMRPEICTSRVINPYGTTVKSGNNVNIYDDTDNTQWWYFEKVSGGYVIRNVMNTSCVLTVQSNANVVVNTYDGGTDQIWSVQNTVTYDANGGSGAPAVQFKNYGETLTLSSTVPTRTNYTFLGWSTDPNATSATYSAGGSFTANTNTTLYAIWRYNSYTVTFKDWDGTTLKTQTVNYGSAATAPSNPSRTGYTFTGWDRSFSSITANITVTAMYSINSYTVTFKNWDGATLKTQTVNYGSAAAAPANPSRTGYTFTGWDSDFSYVTSNLTITAVYSINSYTVTFDANGGECFIASMSVVYGNIYGELPVPLKSMKAFLGWSLSASADDIINSGTIVTTASNHTLYAIWGDIICVRETEYNGHKYCVYSGNVSWWVAKEFCQAQGGYLATITDENEQNIIDSLNEEGRYLWLGASDLDLDGNWEWVTGEPFNYTYWKEGEPTYSNGTEMYLGTFAYQWNDFAEVGNLMGGFILEIPIEYTVTFKDWDGTTLKTQTVNYGSAATAPASPSRTGYTFTGWDKSFSSITANITVTAVYTKKNENYPTYTVTLTDNGDGTATLTAKLPTGIASGKLVIDVSDKLTYVSGSLSSVNGATVNENYTGGTLCVTYAFVNALANGTVILTADFRINGNSELSVSDFTAPQWNVSDGTVRLATEADGDVIKLYEKKSYVLGDANGDEEVDNLDAAWILKYDAGIIGDDDFNVIAVDVNDDGYVDNLDSAWILKYDAGLIPDFGR